MKHTFAAMFFSITVLAACDTASFSDSLRQATINDGQRTYETADLLAPILVDDTSPDAQLYAPGEVLDIKVSMSPSDWDLVRNDVRNPNATPNSRNCPDGPYYGHYTWQQATVVVDGVQLPNVGIRKKGSFGSLSTTKPGIKLKFDKFAKDQKHLGRKRLTLNNNVEDLAMVRQCLTYATFRKAGVIAPRCNYASVTVNDEYIGLYTNVEPIDSQFLTKYVHEKEGDFYEATFSDFRDGWVLTFEDKSDETDLDLDRLHAIREALSLPDDQLVSTLEPLIDLNQFVHYWAMEMMTRHIDGLSTNANNFYIYFVRELDERMITVPWGVDRTFNTNSNNDSFAQTALVQRLYRHPAMQTKLFSVLQTFLKQRWDSESLVQDIRKAEISLEALVDNDPWYQNAADWAGNPASFAQEISDTIEFVENRAGQMQELISHPRGWEALLPERQCE